MKRDPSDFIIDIKIKNCFLDIIQQTSINIVNNLI